MDAFLGWLRRCVATVSLCVIGLGAAAAAEPSGTGATPGWTNAWWASQSDAFASITMDNQTLRQVLTMLRSGETLRVRLSNRYGRVPVVLETVHIGMAEGGALVAPGSNRHLTFGGQSRVSIAPGASVWSDPVTLNVSAMQRLVLSFHAAGRFVSLSRHANGDEFLWRAPGNRSADEGGEGFVRVNASAWTLVDAVDVRSRPGDRVLAVFGDSVAEGFMWSLGQPRASIGAQPGTGFPKPSEMLAGLMLGDNKAFSVVNAGIGGNRLLSPAWIPSLGASGLSRLQQDVLDVPGITDVIVLFGVNDLGLAVVPDATAMIEGLREATARLKAAGLRVSLGTLSPSKGTLNGVVLHGRESVNRAREAVNRWIREEAKVDRVIDFDACLRDPSDPVHFLPAYDSGDHLHPSPAGYEAMVRCIDLPGQL